MLSSVKPLLHWLFCFLLSLQNPALCARIFLWLLPNQGVGFWLLDLTAWLKMHGVLGVRDLGKSIEVRREDNPLCFTHVWKMLWKCMKDCSTFFFKAVKTFWFSGLCCKGEQTMRWDEMLIFLKGPKDSLGMLTLHYSSSYREVLLFVWGQR